MAGGTVWTNQVTRYRRAERGDETDQSGSVKEARTARVVRSCNREAQPVLRLFSHHNGTVHLRHAVVGYPPVVTVLYCQISMAIDREQTNRQRKVYILELGSKVAHDTGHHKGYRIY